MPTFLFDQIIFGPVKSRRLGTSLGINLLPTQSKYCNFNCAYCECGWSDYKTNADLPTCDMVLDRLRAALASMKSDGNLPDVITFAGNGEPTIHPQFLEIIGGTVALRDELSPNCDITVLTNATMLQNPKIKKGLMLADKAFMKIDSAIPATIQLINEPLAPVNLERLAEQMHAFGDKLIIQTMFLRGTVNGMPIDNTTDEELDRLIQFYQKAQPSVLHIYSIARATPLDSLSAIPHDELEHVGKRIESHGIKVNVY